MSVINKILSFLITVLDRILPALNLSQEFIDGFDNFITWLIGLYASASFFIPLDIFVICMTALLLVDGFALGMRVGQFVLKLIRG